MRHGGTVAETRKSLEGGLNVVRPELDHQVNIISKTQITVRVYRDPAGDEIADAGIAKRSDDRLENGKPHAPPSGRSRNRFMQKQEIS